jgi:hypothetical protein
MKICPRCSQQYADDSLNFCLNDGAALSAADYEQPTVLVNQPRTPPPQQFYGAPPNQNWNAAPPVAAQPRKKSRAWLWVLGIFGGIILICGGGFAALIALIPDTNVNYNSGYSNSSNSSSTTGTVLKDDLSKWKPKLEIYGVTNYADNRLTVSTKQKNYYYVLVTPDAKFKTENATTKVIVKNTTGENTNYGYGLIVHSDRTQPLKRDYAFLINAKNQKFRVAQHTNKEEKTVVNWKYLAAIKSGTEENVLEVRDADGKMSFYVNGQLAAEHADTLGYKNGYVGFYVSDAVPIAFSALEIRK